MQITIGYYYEGGQFYKNNDIGNAVTEAFARKYYEEASQLGNENGLYRTLGTLQSIKDRVIVIRQEPTNPNLILDQFQLESGDYRNLDYAYEQAGQILNPPDVSWCNGIFLDKPAAWGDVYSKDANLWSILPEFMRALTSKNRGDKPDQIYRIVYDDNRDRYFFVMTQGQINELCFKDSCVQPNSDYVNEQRKLRDKQK
jgi:hypothetical protein